MKARGLLLVIVALLVLLGIAQQRLWFGNSGRNAVAGLEAQVAAQQQRNMELKRRNDALAAEVRDLKSSELGGAAIEARARDEFGLIKPGETFYRVVESKPPQTPPAQ